MATHIKEVAYVKLAVHVKVTVHIKVTSHVKEAHHVKESGSSTTNRSGAKGMQPVQAKPAERSIGAGTCEPCKLLRVKTDNKANHIEETLEVAKMDNKSPCTDELSKTKSRSRKGAYAVTKDFAAHDNKKSVAVDLTRYTAKALNDTLKTGEVGKLD